MFVRINDHTVRMFTMVRWRCTHASFARMPRIAHIAHTVHIAHIARIGQLLASHASHASHASPIGTSHASHASHASPIGMAMAMLMAMAIENAMVKNFSAMNCVGVQKKMIAMTFWRWRKRHGE